MGVVWWFNPGAAGAWARHDLITPPILEGLDWLDQYEQIPVTPYRYRDDTLNPKFKVVYANPEAESAFPGGDRFVWYDLDSGRKYGFRGAPLGGVTSARRILTEYSNEPDWGMDKGLSVSWSQGFMAGSQGFRHMYYPAFTFHLPYPFFPQGISPERAAHFLDYARQAYLQHDLYWCFRFLARALHYVQDIGQPYHTYQTSIRFIVLSRPIAGTTQATKNYHFAYESFVAYRLAAEAAGKAPLTPHYYSLALTDGVRRPVDSAADLIKSVARENSCHVGKTFKSSVRFLGEKFHSAQEVRLLQKEAERLLRVKSPARKEFDQQVRRALQLTGSAAGSFLEYARQTLLEQPPQVPPK